MDSTTATEITVRQTQESDSSPRVKDKPAGLPLDFIYFPSDDGVDENLLIFLHGLGDTHEPFARLGRSLKLPQTAILALKAPIQIPYLEEEAFQWYPSFDHLGELLPNPNPTAAIDLLMGIIEQLVNQLAWAADRIHLFGFGQGGSLASEVALRWWKGKAQNGLASIVTVCGPLLSHPTSSVNCPTPVLVFHRSQSTSALGSFRKGFSIVKEAKFGGGEGMPRSKDEWEGIMRFWGERLSRRLLSDGGLYEVLTGT